MSEPASAPTFAEREAMWKALDFPLDHRAYPHTEAYVHALRNRYRSGDVQFQSFQIPAHPVLDWYLQRSLFHDCNFFERFWSTSIPAASLPYRLLPLNFFDQTLFRWSTPFHLAGDLSSILYSGGAYSTGAGYSREARRLGEATAAELLQDDYEESLYFHCASAWSDFFSDVAWDHTLLVISKPRRLIHVLLATDTD